VGEWPSRGGHEHDSLIVDLCRKQDETRGFGINELVVVYVVKMLFTVESSDGDVVSVVGRGAESRADANPRVSFYTISRPLRSTMSRDRVLTWSLTWTLIVFLISHTLSGP
jgi:hypothetical protein